MKRHTPIHHLLRTLVAVAVATSPLACDTESEPDEVELRAGKHFDGRDLFAGIVLGQGDVAELLPLSWEDCERDARMKAFAELPPDLMVEEIDRIIEAQPDDELTPALKQARKALASGQVSMDGNAGFDTLTSLVEEADPKYFDRLEKAVYSGDRAAIQEAVLDGFLLTKGLLTVENSVIEIGADQGSGVAVAFVAVAVVAYVLIWIEVGVGKPFIDETILQQEILVDEIAQNIAGY